jgi:dUTP pyrophosphatase
MLPHKLDNLYRNIKACFSTPVRNFAILLVSIQDNQLKQEYTDKIRLHNLNITNNVFPDSGFDLIVPEDNVFDKVFESKFIDMQVKAEMIYCDVNSDVVSTCAYKIHPRSSISKTPLMLSNHTGIIDSGYRGNLIGAFRLLSSPTTFQNYTVSKFTRLLQVCHPTLCPVYVVIVEENELSTTERANNGFGSTGL